MKYNKRILFSAVLLLMFFNLAIAQDMIPKPNSYTPLKGSFSWDSDMIVYINADHSDANRLKHYIKEVFGFTKILKHSSKHLLKSCANGCFEDNKKTLTLTCTNKANLSKGYLPTQQQQGYNIQIDAKHISVTAPTACGLFYALQTLRQLTTNGKIQCATITDSPRFMYRGLQLDCSRHFWTKDFIKKQLDAMAYFKLNVFHWHLVDGGGWRLQIKKYPRLVRETAYRTYSSWDKWRKEDERGFAHKQDPNAYGGYYTQEDVKEIVRYASDRHIEIIPEIEMPGHSEEVTFAYPELSCSKKNNSHEDLCPSDERTYVFMTNVLKEVFKLFPSKYIHIGGDEAMRSTWETCERCQKKMRELQLTSTSQLQSYFTHRIEQFLNKNGRKLIGWDEIMEGELAPNAAVTSWRGEQYGLKAAKLGHKVVMSPVGYCYIDMFQDAPNTQPKAQGGYLPLRRIYSYDPVPKQYKGTQVESNIIGLQACLWTEYVEDSAHAEYMIYPRVLAIAETGWAAQKEDYNKFRVRAITAVDTLKSWGFNPFDLANEAGIRPQARRIYKHDAREKKIIYNAPYAEKYRAEGDSTLVNGKAGDWGYIEGGWQGFINGFDVVIDFGKDIDISSVKADFLHINTVWIFTPNEIELSVSSDNKIFTTIDKRAPKIKKEQVYCIYPYSWKGQARGRYLRLKAKGNIIGGWIFTDEIRVNEEKYKNN